MNQRWRPSRDQLLPAAPHHLHTRHDLLCVDMHDRTNRNRSQWVYCFHFHAEVHVSVATSALPHERVVLLPQRGARGVAARPRTLPLPVSDGAVDGAMKVDDGRMDNYDLRRSKLAEFVKAVAHVVAIALAETGDRVVDPIAG